MNEATGFEAKTIHRLLEVDPKAGGFRRDSRNPLDRDLLVIDETSMVDVLLRSTRSCPGVAMALPSGQVSSPTRGARVQS